MRGSIAGTTYLTTPAGQIIARQRTRPVNTPTPFRTNVKNAFEQAVAQWQALSVPKQAQWNTWALAHMAPKTGRQVMIAGNAFAEWIVYAGYIAGASVHVDPFVPSIVALPAVVVQAVTFTPALSTGVSCKVTNLSANPQVVMVEISGSQSESRNFYKGPWDPTQTLCVTLNAGANNTFNFSGLIVNTRYFMRMRSLNNGTLVGQSGTVLNSAQIVFSKAVTNP